MSEESLAIENEVHQPAIDRRYSILATFFLLLGIAWTIQGLQADGSEKGMPLGFGVLSFAIMYFLYEEKVFAMRSVFYLGLLYACLGTVSLVLRFPALGSFAPLFMGVGCALVARKKHQTVTTNIGYFMLGVVVLWSVILQFR